MSGPLPRGAGGVYGPAPAPAPPRACDPGPPRLALLTPLITLPEPTKRGGPGLGSDVKVPIVFLRLFKSFNSSSLFFVLNCIRCLNSVLFPGLNCISCLSDFIIRSYIFIWLSNDCSIVNSCVNRSILLYYQLVLRGSARGNIVINTSH